MVPFVTRSTSSVSPSPPPSLLLRLKPWHAAPARATQNNSNPKLLYHCCMGFGQKNYLDNLAMATRVDPSVLA